MPYTNSDTLFMWGPQESITSNSNPLTVNSSVIDGLDSGSQPSASLNYLQDFMFGKDSNPK